MRFQLSLLELTSVLRGSELRAAVALSPVPIGWPRSWSGHCGTVVTVIEPGSSSSPLSHYTDRATRPMYQKEKTALWSTELCSLSIITRVAVAERKMWK